MFRTTLLLTALVSATASAAPLKLDPAHPPVQVDERRWSFEDRAELRVLPGVVLTLDAGVTPPDGAKHLGGPNWLLPASSPAAAVSEALRQTARPGVRAFPDVVVPKRLAEDVPSNDPNREGQWYLDDLEYDALYAYSWGTAETRVAVIDSGIDIIHADLADAVDAPYDAFDDDNDPSPNPGEFCSQGNGICDTHGTSVSGVVAARGDNGVGIVGLCPRCTLIPIKLLSDAPGSLSVDIRAFEHAIAQDVAVINNSWGFVDATSVPDALAEVIHRASTEPRDGKGALVVFAAGNDDRELFDYEMEALPEVLCVSAVDSYGQPTNYTNYGDPIDVAAPSATVTIAPGDEVTFTFGGTSAAAPVASGLAAWAASVAPELTSAELHALLVDNATPAPLYPVDDEGRNEFFGDGLINALGVLEALVPGSVNAGDDDDSAADEDGDGCSCSTDPLQMPAPLTALIPLLALLRRRR